MLTSSDHTYGLKTVYDPSAPNDATPSGAPARTKPTAEIIFVHGLGGTSKGTWTHKNMLGGEQAFWPSWLHEIPELANSRIRTFGYNADWNMLEKLTNLGVRSFGIDLSHQLREPPASEPKIEVSPSIPYQCTEIS